jgi:hypothetical protein
MWHRLFAIVIALAWFGWSAGNASAEQRLALVIGNSAYESNLPLSNPQNDAQAVAQLLNTAGFEVVMAFDLSRDIMKQTIEEFSARVAEKGADSAALVYYAGHGLQVDGENYLVPVDARLTKEDDLAQHGVRLADVMGALQSAPSKIRIVILDACRNNPFSGATGGRGLAIVDAPAGTIVAYSTAPGTEALDGSGKHSPFAAAFMRIAKQPDLPIEQVFKKVRRLVNDSTDNKQTPWESSSLTSDFVFFSSIGGQSNNPGAPAGSNAPAANGGSNAPSAPRAAGGAPGGRPQIERVTVADLGSRPAIQAYDVVIEEDSIEYYEEFIRLYPADPLTVHIRRKLGLRKEMVEWQNVTYRNTPEAYARFASTFNNGAMFLAARKLQERPRNIEIAFPRRGDPRLNEGRFGNFKVNVVRSSSLINFPRGQQNNAGGNRNPVIPFQRNENKDQNRNQNENKNQNQGQNKNQNQNQKQANLPSNANQNKDNKKSKLDQDRNTLKDRNKGKGGRDADNKRGTESKRVNNNGRGKGEGKFRNARDGGGRNARRGDGGGGNRNGQNFRRGDGGGNRNGQNFRRGDGGGNRNAQNFRSGGGNANRSGGGNFRQVQNVRSFGGGGGGGRNFGGGGGGGGRRR